MVHLVSRRRFACGALIALVSVLGCAQPGGPPTPIVPPETTFYVGPAACSSCHANFAATFGQTGHAQALKPVLDGAPVYPAPSPGVPNPPAGFAFNDISYIIDGYEKAGRFIDINGFQVTNGTAGTNTQYNLAIPAIEQPAGYVPYLPGQTTPLPFEFNDFFRWTTGPQPLAASGQHQDNRPGINGTWAQPGVQCEACHGPGSQHIPNPSAGNIDLDANSVSCIRCHSNGADPTVIAVSDGLVVGFQQVTELSASPHAGFSCIVCHNPHASAIYDPANGIINDCTVCHPNLDMALHKGFVYQEGSYSEPVTCASCHMPYIVKTFSAVDLQLTNGRSVHLGDTHSHIFLLDPTIQEAGMFTADGTQVAVNSQGKAAISTCFVCQRCHNGKGNAFAFPPQEGCSFGSGIHDGAQ